MHWQLLQCKSRSPPYPRCMQSTERCGDPQTGSPRGIINKKGVRSGEDTLVLLQCGADRGRSQVGCGEREESLLCRKSFSWYTAALWMAQLLCDLAEAQEGSCSSRDCRHHSLPASLPFSYGLHCSQWNLGNSGACDRTKVVCACVWVHAHMYGRCAFLCTHTRRPEEVTGSLTLSFSETSLIEPKRVASKPQRSPLFSHRSKVTDTHVHT